MNPELIDVYSRYQNDDTFRHLRTGGSNFVPGEGNDDRPRYLFCGEAPGAYEDKQRRPFVGPAGRLLREFFRKYEVDDYFLTNVLKYRPPQNRRPVADEKRVGRDYVSEEIDIVNPDLVVLVGGTALTAFFGTSLTITRTHGKIAAGKYFAMYHPAAAIYDESKRSLIDEDFQRLTEIGNSIARDATAGT
jgi:DNA polymerase